MAEVILNMVGVVLKEGEVIDAALRRFKRECINANVQGELKRHEFYEKPSEKRKRKQKEALRKKKRRRFTPMPFLSAEMKKKKS